MIKNKEWLKKEINDNHVEREVFLGELGWEITSFKPSFENFEELFDLIDQLNEPEITEMQAWEKIAKYYPSNVPNLINYFEDFYYNEGTKEPGKAVIPHYIAEWIEANKREEAGLGDAITDSYGVYELGDWIVINENLFARAWLDGYTIEQPKTYRFTLNAFHEIDVNATSLEEAQKEADKTWNQYFARNRDFGEAEFEGKVDEEGELTE